MKRFIASGVLAERQMENIDTGLDMRVPDFSIEKSSSDRLATASITYLVVIVTDIPCIVNLVRNSSTGEKFPVDSVIHLTQNRTYDEIWRLRRDLDQAYSGTYVPDLPKRMGRGGSLVASKSKLRIETRNRQTSADNFFKWCSSSKKISASSILLKFIGWSPEQPSRDDAVGEDDVDELTAETSKILFKKTVDEDEIEEKLFGKSKDTEDKGDLFTSEETLEEGFDVVKLGKIETSDEVDDSAENQFKSARLFDAIVEDDIGQDVKRKSTSQDIKLQDYEDFEEDLTDVTSQLKELKNVEAPKNKAPKSVISELPTTNVSSVDVSEMADNDLAKYIEEQEVDDELDLGI